MSTINVKKFHIFQKGSDDLSDFNIQIGATLDTDALSNIKAQIEATPINLKSIRVGKVSLDNIKEEIEASLQSSSKNISINVPQIKINAKSLGKSNIVQDYSKKIERK